MGLLPEPGDERPGLAIYLPVTPGLSGSRSYRSCNCATSRERTCSHLHRLMAFVTHYGKSPENRSGRGLFADSLWYRTAFRLLERLGKAPQTAVFRNRAGLLERLGLLLRSESEQMLNHAGSESTLQALEKSFWGRLTYHCFREYGEPEGSFHPSIDETTGEFILAYTSPKGVPAARLVVSRRQVQAVLAFLQGAFPEQEGLAIHPLPLKSIFKASESTEFDLEVRPVIRALQASGETRFFEQEDLETFTYGNLVYIKELQILAELERPGRERKFRAPISMKLAKSRVPSFMSEHRQEIDEGAIVFDDSLSSLEIFDSYDQVFLEPTAVDRSWYWLSVEYGFGNHKVSLHDILRAQKQGLPYLDTPDGWIDLNAPAMRELSTLLGERVAGDGQDGPVRLSPAEALRLTSLSVKPVELQGDDEKSALLKRLLALEPSTPAGRLEAMATPLRGYQKIGLDWTRFLYENSLGGLLCDDMGLGKTHQAMALMAWLRQQNVNEPFLVVCPTTVISHWHDKIREHAPGLKAVAYHAADRSLEEAFAEPAVLVTSYGILRNDILALEKVSFGLAVFDEIQHIKNKATQSYEAARFLNASMKVGLTGTPIENRVEDLKALFDLVLPGYLGSDEDFARTYGNNGGASETRLKALRKITSPFVLRRLKEAVLDELPEKIEDIRTCRLSEDQVKLYRDAIEARGARLVERLHNEGERLPYIHVFALLALLKRICDHPALVLDKGREKDSVEKYASGKWELFQELLFESLDSGQKVVVFTQFLGMIEMMECLLSRLDVGFATLTGASRRRGEIIRRFNEEAECCVFLGSLKAGGTGIDLMAGSVVIHYDRWWNAAREDQATDRVHRIGQKKAVQVFKLVTEGTLEEKISAIIDRKRKLMNAVVQTDDPHLTKLFTREELIDLLQPLSDSPVPRHSG